MYYVEGFLELSQLGFIVRKSFSGFVVDKPEDVEHDGRKCVMINDIPVPAQNVTRVSEVNVSGVDVLDLSKLFPPASRREITKASFSKTPLFDEFKQWRQEFFHRVDGEFKDAVKAKELSNDTVVEVTAVMKERLEFYGASISVSENNGDSNLARITFRYATTSANDMFIRTLAESHKPYTVKELIKAFKEGRNAR